MQLRHEQQEQGLKDAALGPRTCPFEEAAIYIFASIGAGAGAAMHSGRRRSATYSSGLLSLPASAGKINLIMHLRLGCLRQFPVVQGRHYNSPREQWLCRLCPFHVEDEKYLIFVCPACDFFRDHRVHLCEEQQTVLGFMNQDCVA